MKLFNSNTLATPTNMDVSLLARMHRTDVKFKEFPDYIYPLVNIVGRKRKRNLKNFNLKHREFRGTTTT